MPVKQYQPGDPDGRAAAGGRASKGVPKRSKLQKAADLRMAKLLQAVPQLPPEHKVPGHMEVQAMARAFAPAALDFASEVLSSETSHLSDKFNAANLLLKHGAMQGAAEAEEIGKLKGILGELATEHKAATKDMADELATLRKENVTLAEQLAEARSKIRTTPAEEIEMPKVASG